MKKRIIDIIHEKIDIVNFISQYLSLSKKGNNFVSVCPFHNDSNPSLTVSPKKNIFKCFSCGVGGDVIFFLSEFQKISYAQALNILAESLGIKVKQEVQIAKYTDEQQKLIDILQNANDFFMAFLKTKKGEKALNYLNNRNLDNAIVEKFKIGFTNLEEATDFLKTKYDLADLMNVSLINEHSQKAFFKERIIFPIENVHGDIVGFSGRSFNENQEVKYLNSSENLLFNKSEILYNFFNAKPFIEKFGEIIIVEGFMDVIALYKIGVFNVVALMGTNFSVQHLELLKNYKIILMFDGDNAGLVATLKTILKLVNKNILVQVIENNIGKDADEVLNKNSKEKLQSLVNNKINWLEFVYKHFINQIGNNIHGLIDFFDKFKPYFKLTNILEQNFFINKITKDLNLENWVVAEKLSFIKEDQIVNKAPAIPRENQKFIPKKKNYSYILIRSMIANKDFIPIFVRENIHFDKPELLSIEKYLVQYNETQILNEGLNDKIKAIFDEDQELAKTELEFLEYIKKLKKSIQEESSKKLLESMYLTKDPEIRKEYLKAILKNKKRILNENE